MAEMSLEDRRMKPCERREIQADAKEQKASVIFEKLKSRHAQKEEEKVDWEGRQRLDHEGPYIPD